MGKGSGAKRVRTIRQVPVLRPLVAIVGRPNVGKSTLFNRLLQSRKAITDDRPGVTRDRIYAQVEWEGRRFTLVDTGGYVPHSKDAIEAAVRTQIDLAVEEADAILLVCDVQSGLTDLDREMAEFLRRHRRPCIVVVNKIDHPDRTEGLDEFYGLGLGDPIPVSAATGRRSGDLLERLMDLLGSERFADVFDADEAIRVALAGRPNVGKSTLINRLAGAEVSIVHDRPGTTRDTTSTRLAWKDRELLVMDTAGLRRRSRVDDPVEFYSGRRAIDSLEKADVVVVLIDALEGWTAQDARIVDQVIEAGRGLVLAVNKWDLIDGEGQSAKEFAEHLRDRAPFLRDYPVVFTSALTGKRVQRCIDLVLQVYERRNTRISTARLNEFLEDLCRRSPPFGGGREIKLLYSTQYSVAPPTFVVFSNHPERISEAYRRFVERKLREEFDFEGTPLRIYWRGKRV